MPSNLSAIPSLSTNAMARTATRQRLRVGGNLKRPLVLVVRAVHERPTSSDAMSVRGPNAAAV